MTAGSLNTQGGNITAANIDTETLTGKWADFYGNVSGNLSLRDSTNYVYKWTWTPASGGEVCLSTASAFNFDAATTASTATMNTAWGFGTAADNFPNTYNTTCGTALDFSQISVSSSTPAAALQGSSTYTSCAINNGAGTGKDNHAFCTHINSAGTAYNGVLSNYEVMVPTSPTPNTVDTYYFYAELN